MRESFTTQPCEGVASRMNKMIALKTSNSWRAWAVIVLAVCSTAEMPPISDQARAGLDRTIGAKGVYVSEESAYKFTFSRTDVSVRVGRQRLSPTQAPQSWATFQPSMQREGMTCPAIFGPAEA